MSTRRQFFKKSLGVTATALASGPIAKAAMCQLTAAQTPGPFIPDDFPFREPNEGRPYLSTSDSDTDLTQVGKVTGQLPKGQIIYVRGQVVDQHCRPVANANVYLWQADDKGHYNHHEDPNVSSVDDLDPNFQYRGVAVTNSEGRFRFKTIKPKYYPLDPSGDMMRTAHLHVSVLHPNCQPLTTQTYFEGDVLEDIQTIRALNSNDIILSPRGSIRPELEDLIIHFANDPAFTDGPVGDVTLSVMRR